MSDLTIFLDDDLETRLLEQASQNNRSIEEEALQILCSVLIPQVSDEGKDESESGE